MISEFGLFVFTVLAGMAAGAYILRAIVPLKSERAVSWAFDATTLVLLVISGVALLLHLGLPLRVVNAFNNLGAGIAQEGMTTILFGIAVLVDCIFCIAKKDAPRWWVIITAVLGLAMTVVMGLAYMQFIGEPAWSTPATVLFFVFGDFSMGAGMYLLFNRVALSEKRFLACFVAAQVFAIVGMGALVAHFAAEGFDVALLVVGLVVGPVASAIVGLLGGKKDKASWAYAACALAIVGGIIARYAFYAASIY